jgi:hypothetical protein
VVRQAPEAVFRIDRVGDELVYLTLDEEADRTRVIRERGGERRELLSRPFEPHRADLCSMRCRARCLVATREGPELRFSWLDLDTGGLAPLDLEAPSDARNVAWDLSPDGARLALASPPGRLEVHDLGSGAVERWPLPLQAPTDLAWSADGERVFVSGLTFEAEAYRLLEVGPGSARTVWGSMSWHLYRPTPSPDGRHLAFAAYAFDDDLWLAEGLGG